MTRSCNSSLWRSLARAAIAWASWALLATAGRAEEPAFRFRDAAESAGLFPGLENIQGHAAGWGDVDQDGELDLYVATFHGSGTKPNFLMRQRNGKFFVDDQPAVAIPSRATGALFSDFDNDGDLDLYVSSMPQPKNQIRGCALFRNEGGGKFTDVSEGNGACPAEFGGRSATSCDVDGDGLLDLLVGEDPLPGYNGSPTKRSRLFRNRGDLQFDDVTQTAGLPDSPGLGVAAGDLTGDGWPELFLASHHGGNRVLVNDGRGKFQEATHLTETFAWPESGGDNMVCGVTLGDVNRDGRLDIALGPHFKTPWVSPVAPRLFLNGGLRAGRLVFQEVTEPSGLRPLALKTPHLEIQDFDNDGWPDLAVSIVKFAGDVPVPIIFRHTGIQQGVPGFQLHGWDVNDYPTAADQALRRTGDFYKKMLADGKILYAAPMPAADYNRDGRLDFFCASWWAERRSLLLKNETPGGNWLQITLTGPSGVNHAGIGARIFVYPSGKLGDAASLIGCQEIGTGFGYASAHEALAHFGLGQTPQVDVRVEWPHGKGVFEQRGVQANHRLQIDGSPAVK